MAVDGKTIEIEVDKEGETEKITKGIAKTFNAFFEKLTVEARNEFGGLSIARQLKVASDFMQAYEDQQKEDEAAKKDAEKDA